MNAQLIMLLQRVTTAIVLLAILLPVLFAANPLPFIALMWLFMTTGAWEWARLNQVKGVAALGVALAFALICFGLWRAGAIQEIWPVLWLVSALIWVLGGCALLLSGTTGWLTLPRILRVGLGLSALCVAWLAMVQARAMGINFLLSVLALVWVADIAAYFAGRALGGRLTAGRKLAPSISPGKSWEGAVAGMLGVWIASIVWVAADGRYPVDAPSFYSRLQQAGWGLWVLGLCFLTVMSVVGDLVESLVKRAAGQKDSSHLLPGHGGVMDRIDALLPTLPLAMLLVSWLGSKS